MSELVDFGVWFLVAIAVAPLLILLAYVIADSLRLKVAERILVAAERVTILQWLVGSLVNLVGGLALIGVGLWVVIHVPAVAAKVGGALALLLGLWRAWIGACVLRETRKAML